eukprot:2290587-Rhodomonas_salina.1
MPRLYRSEFVDICRDLYSCFEFSLVGNDMRARRQESMWADIVQLAGLRRHPGVIQMLMAPDPTEGKGHRCHYDEDWGFKVLIDKFVSPHATLDSEVYGSFCQGQ